LATQKHTVRKGETLIKIAKSYGIADWKAIFDAPENAKLKKERKKPEAIQPGDVLVIPPSPVDPKLVKDLAAAEKSLLAAIARRDSLRKEFQASITQAKSEIKSAAAKYKRTSQAVDAAAMVIMIHKDLAKMTYDSSKVLKGMMESEAFQKEAIKTTMMWKVDVIGPALLEIFGKLDDQSGKVRVAVVSLAKSFFDLTSPSFWGKVFVKLGEEDFVKKVASGRIQASWESWSKAVTYDPQEEFDAMIANIDRNAAPILRQLDDLDKRDKAAIAALKDSAKAAGR
jgi:LysM repeat protein